MIYLASPYSHPDPDVREQRFLAACRAAASLMRDGEFVYAPICHSHPIAQFGLPWDWDYWEATNRAHLTRCTELFVLTIDGWIDSVGVQAEIRIAAELDMPITYIDATGRATLARVARLADALKEPTDLRNEAQGTKTAHSALASRDG